MNRTLIALLLVLLLALPAAAEGDERLNPSGAEYYTIYCRDDLMFAYRADGQYALRAPLAYLVGLDAGGGTWESGGVTVTRAGDTITVSGHNGNGAPEYGEKAFSLAACLGRNGYTPAPQTPPAPRPARSAPAANPCLYTVREGDTAFYIADRYGTSLDLLALYNRIENVGQIYVGQQIRIPGCAGVATGVTVQESGYAYGTARGGRTHTVRAGEMLQWIADRYGVTVQALVAANGITNANLIWEDTVLVIP
ncbi:MAG: LysM peptidoglycan-binding domain-containing protein [Anaerolineae bacterium]|nr:LysM peptidoglycan-binding domain-containing protein [Anaerolineae bacterium]